MNPKPGCECNGTLDLVPVCAHFGDGSIAADHRHDAFVLVSEVCGLFPGDVVEDVLSSPSS